MLSELKTVPYYHHLERQLDPEQLLHYPSVGQSFSSRFNDAYEQAQQICLTSQYVKELYVVQYRDLAGGLHFSYASASQIGSGNMFSLRDICAVVRMK